jgi:protoheme ferro-lyase
MSENDTALLLVNLGTPRAPTPREVRRYLGEFLGDPRVVQIPRWLWWPLLHGVILPLRSARVARKYAEIWRPDGSPLAALTRQLSDAVQSQAPGMRVDPCHALWRAGHRSGAGEALRTTASNASWCCRCIRSIRRRRRPPWPTRCVRRPCRSA